MPDEAPATSDLRPLGPPRLLRAGAAVHVDARKAMALLALLALEGAWPSATRQPARRQVLSIGRASTRRDARHSVRLVTSP
jgi:hypothetical protein